jgi:uncharacterized protein (DUF433 family)
MNFSFLLETLTSTMFFMSEPIISISKDVMGGTPVFVGTRVPVQTLIDYLTAGDSIDDFLEGFPTVSREQVIEFLKQAEAQVEKIAA